MYLNSPVCAFVNRECMYLHADNWHAHALLQMFFGLLSSIDRLGCWCPFFFFGFPPDVSLSRKFSPQLILFPCWIFFTHLSYRSTKLYGRCLVQWCCIWMLACNCEMTTWSTGNSPIWDACIWHFKATAPMSSRSVPLTLSTVCAYSVSLWRHEKLDYLVSWISYSSDVNWKLLVSLQFSSESQTCHSVR